MVRQGRVVTMLSIAAVTVGLGLAGCGSSGHQVGSANTGQSAQASALPTATVTVTATLTPSQPSVPATPQSPAEANPPIADVQLLGCVVTDDPYHLNYHSGQFVGVADLKVTNHSSKVSDYIISVEFVDSQGNRLDMTYGNVTKLAPGQSQNNNDEDATGTKLLGEGAKVTCRILSVDRVASTQ